MSGFLAMRADLVERGLLDAEHQLTAAGHDHVDQLLVELRGVEAEIDLDGPRVRWRIDLAGNAHRAGSAPRTRRPAHA